eukprot:c23220_g1_i2 orf=257-2101(+)
MTAKWLSIRALEQHSIEEDSDAKYMYVSVKAPRLVGISLRMFMWAMEAPILGHFLLKYLKNENLITKVFIGSHFLEPPMHIPQYPAVDFEELAVIKLEPDLSPPERVALALDCLGPTPLRHKTEDHKEHFQHWAICDYAKAYTSGKATPTKVAEQFLLAIEESHQSTPVMGFFINYNREDIMKQASDSTDRFVKGQQLSVLDGVPIAVKDEIDCLPYPTTGGTKWIHKVRHVMDDATCVKRLRACGAVIVGKTNMHELGAGATGINPHYGATRNPYDWKKYSGGSSGGSAAVVAAGLCPAALGVDGGGSVRMPAALCGVVGFKSNFGRITSFGVLPLNWTVGMVGVLAATVEDAIIVYAAILGHLPEDRIVSLPPPANLPVIRDLEDGKPEAAKLIGGLRLAKYTEWFDDSDDAVKNSCYRALDLLKQVYGCQVKEITVPEIEEMRLAHYVTIGSECYTSIGLTYEKIGMANSGADTRVALAIYSSFSNCEFINAQRMRYRQMHYHMEIFKKADIIVTPTTGCTAQHIDSVALRYGELNYPTGAKLMRYQIAGNFLGLPAISIPVGHDSSGMPIGLQLIGRPWSEATLLRLAFAIESLCARFRKQPQVSYDLLL